MHAASKTLAFSKDQGSVILRTVAADAFLTHMPVFHCPSFER
ncbi:hypothetical protein [Marinobacter sp.]